MTGRNLRESDGAIRPHVLARACGSTPGFHDSGESSRAREQGGAIGRTIDLLVSGALVDAPGSSVCDGEQRAAEAPASDSDSMERVYDLIDRVAPTEASVFLTGESGTGKEFVARRIHDLSGRRAGPFMAVNCGALAPTLIESELFGHEKGSFTGADRRRLGYFERAGGGTLFLDEITEMPVELQVKLLRVLETGAVTRVGATEAARIDVRILAATNRDPLDAVSKGALRKDLFYRLNVFPIHLPALRDRGGDVVSLAQGFLDQVNAREGTAKQFSPGALERLKRLAWRGNVRELKNSVERAAILADAVVRSRDLPALEGVEAARGSEEVVLDIQVGSRLDDVEQRVITATLAALGGNKKEAARVLGISLKTLYSRIHASPADAQPARATNRVVDASRLTAGGAVAAE